MKKVNKIHQKPEDVLAENSQSTVSAIRENTAKLGEVKKSIDALHETEKSDDTEALGFTGVIQSQKETNSLVKNLHEAVEEAPTSIVHKLEEVKSANLITNRLLKEINQKEAPEPKEFPKELDVTLKGVSLVTIKGDKGDKGEKGERGERGEKGDSIKGDRGEKGLQGERGLQGETGKRGANGTDGKDGRDGIDGSPDTPEQVVDKVNNSTKKIDAKQVRGLESALRFVDQYGNNPSGVVNSGANPLVFRSAGTRITDTTITDLNITGTGGTLTYSNNGVATLDLTGGSAGHTIQDEGNPLTARTNLNFVGAGVAVTDDAGNDATVVTINGGSGNSFETIVVAGQADVVADSSTDTLTLVAGSGVTITTNAGTDTITFSATGSAPSFARTLMFMGG